MCAVGSQRRAFSPRSCGQCPSRREQRQLSCALTMKHMSCTKRQIEEEVSATLTGVVVTGEAPYLNSESCTVK